MPSGFVRGHDGRILEEMYSELRLDREQLVRARDFSALETFLSEAHRQLTNAMREQLENHLREYISTLEPNPDYYPTWDQIDGIYTRAPLESPILVTTPQHLHRYSHMFQNIFVFHCEPDFAATVERLGVLYGGDVETHFDGRDRSQVLAVRFIVDACAATCGETIRIA